MPSCPGKRTKDNITCHSNLYRCKKCVNIGCNQGRFGTCTNQGFEGGKCLKCGAYGQMEPFR